MTSIDLNWLVSVDDHVIEPGHVWQDRLPAGMRDRGPRLVQDDEGEAWLYEDRRIRASGLGASAGRSKEDFTTLPIPYSEMRAGCYDSAARLEDMNRAGILASLCFPSVPRFCGQLFHEAKDKDLALRCVQAYNDWMIEEWCGSAPGRFIPMVITPLWDPWLAAKEIERCAGKGARAVAFSENPEPLGLPSITDPSNHWDPLLRAAQDAGLPVCIHVGSSSTTPRITSDAPYMANMAYGAVRTAGAMLSWLFSGYFERLPGLKVSLAEGNIGWIPFFLERAEQVIDKQRHWTARGENYDGGYGGATMNNFKVSDDFDLRRLFREHLYGCFLEDTAGIRLLDLIGEDNVMVETDYPHSDSTWPNCIDIARAQVAHLPEETQYKVLRGNAERLFTFTPAEPPAMAR